MMFHQTSSRLQRAPNVVAQRIAAYRNLRSQIPALKDLSATQTTPPTTDGRWLRGVDFYRPTELTRVLIRTFAHYHLFHSCYPNLLEPQGFNEWVVRSNFLRWMKIPESGNKMLTSSFIPGRMQNAIQCPEILWRGRRVDWAELDQVLTSDNYYLKATHGSYMSKRFRWPLAEQERRDLSITCAQWLRHSYGLLDGEWWYSASPPMLIIEADVGGNGFSVNCFCFRGKVGLVVLHSAASGETITLSEELEVMGHKNGDSDSRALFSREVLEEIRRLASELSRDTEFARFDFLVSASGSVFLGEVTFSPGNGHSRRPRGVDEHLGRMWADCVAS